MTPLQARQVLAIAERGSISAGARELGMTQPALSNALSTIEERLGVTLFVRSTRRLQTTAAFRDLRRPLERLVNADRAIAEATANLDRKQKTLRVGISPVVDHDRIAPILQKFEVELIELNLADLNLQLSRGSLDLVLAPRVPGRARFKRFSLYREPLMVVQQAAGGDAVELRELQRETVLMVPDGCGLARVTQGLFRKQRIRMRRSPTQALGYHVLERWALQGRGVAILPVSKIAGGSSRRLIAGGAPAELDVLALTRPNEHATAPLMALLGALRDSIAR